MAFQLDELPYAYDALQPYMSAETLQYHHDKHHLAYVENGNKLLQGSGLEDKNLIDIVKISYGRNQALFNNAGQHYNHLHFWKWMKKDGGGNKLPGKLEQKIASDLGGYGAFREAFIEAGKSQFGSGWAWLTFKDGKLEVTKTPNGENPLVHGGTRSLASTFGNTPTTSTIATRARNTLRLSSTTSSIGNMSKNFSTRPKARGLPKGR